MLQRTTDTKSTYLTAKELDIPQALYDGLVKLHDMMLMGEVAFVPTRYTASVPSNNGGYTGGRCTADFKRAKDITEATKYLYNHLLGFTHDGGYLLHETEVYEGKVCGCLLVLAAEIGGCDRSRIYETIFSGDSSLRDLYHGRFTHHGSMDEITIEEAATAIEEYLSGQLAL